MELRIVRPDGSVEDREPIGDREPETEIAARLAPLADLYQGTGYTAVLVLADREIVVGTFGPRSRS